MNARAVAQQTIEQALRQALELGQFVLHYQPKVNLQTRAVTGAEALLRLRQGGELIAPPFFLRVAENSGLIIPIGRWVLRQACQQMAAWVAAGHALEQMAGEGPFLGGDTPDMADICLVPQLFNML